MDARTTNVKEQLDKFIEKYKALDTNNIISVELSWQDGLVVFYIGPDRLQNWISFDDEVGFEEGVNKGVSYILKEVIIR